MEAIEEIGKEAKEFAAMKGFLIRGVVGLHVGHMGYVDCPCKG